MPPRNGSGDSLVLDASQVDTPPMASSTSGRVVWYELLTSDPSAAIAFYTEVVGWKTQPWRDDYVMWLAGDAPIGGVVRLPEKAKQLGASPFWQASVEVANLDEIVAKAKAIGGTIHHTEDVPDIGRLAVIGDPQGAVMCAYQPQQSMADRDRSAAGMFSWHELYTTDYQAGFAFYRALYGWERIDEYDMGPMGKYLLWGRNGQTLGGMMTMPPGMKTPDGRPVPPSWMYYITTPDLDAALARATQRGARILNGPMPVPGGQRIVQLMDPQGAAFALVTPPSPTVIDRP